MASRRSKGMIAPLLLGLLVALLFWRPSLAPAQEEGFVGRIVRVAGYGIVVRLFDGRDVPASAGLDLFSGDKVSAGPGSEIRMIAADGSLIWLGEESVLELGGLETSADGKATTLTLNLPAGYLKTAAENFDPSRLSTIRVWTENAVAAVSEDAMVVLESGEGTKVIGFSRPVRVYGREHPETVEETVGRKVCLVPGGRPARPARSLSGSERQLLAGLFGLGSRAEGKTGTGRARAGAFIPTTTTTTTTTTDRITTTTDVTTSSTGPGTTTTTLIIPQ